MGGAVARSSYGFSHAHTLGNGQGGLRFRGTQEKIFFCKGRGTRFRREPGFLLDRTFLKQAYRAVSILYKVSSYFTSELLSSLYKIWWYEEFFVSLCLLIIYYSYIYIYEWID